MAIILAGGRTVGLKLAWATKWHKTNSWLLTDGNNLAPAVFFGFTITEAIYQQFFCNVCTLITFPQTFLPSFHYQGHCSLQNWPYFSESHTLSLSLSSLITVDSPGWPWSHNSPAWQNYRCEPHTCLAICFCWRESLATTKIGLTCKLFPFVPPSC